VDALLQRPEYGMVWALKFGDLFVLRKEYLGRKNAMQLQQWLTEQFNANRPWDKIATDILTATGDPHENRAGFYWISRAPKKRRKVLDSRTEATAEMTAQVFLGNRIGCAKCHNHPTEKTTQDDYYRLSPCGSRCQARAAVVASSRKKSRRAATATCAIPAPARSWNRAPWTARSWRSPRTRTGASKPFNG
jgi:hypothetical protein